MKIELHKVIWALVAAMVIFFAAAYFKPAHALDNQNYASVGFAIADNDTDGGYLGLDGRNGAIEYGASFYNNKAEFNGTLAQANLGAVLGGENFGVSAGVNFTHAVEGNDLEGLAGVNEYVALIYDAKYFEGRVQYNTEIDDANDETVGLHARVNTPSNISFDVGYQSTPDEDFLDDGTITAGISLRF